MEELEKLRFPIGKYMHPESIDRKRVDEWITGIEELPAQINEAVIGLSDAQLDTPYRPEGWTIRQVVHHLVDSHINAYIRFKLSLTEDNPTIRPYFEDRWAEAQEAKHGPVSYSLGMLHFLHERWTAVLKNMTEEDFERTIFHPEHQKTFKMNFMLGMYSWHGQHHLAHITETVKREGW